MSGVPPSRDQPAPEPARDPNAGSIPLDPGAPPPAAKDPEEPAGGDPPPPEKPLGDPPEKDKANV